MSARFLVPEARLLPLEGAATNQAVSEDDAIVATVLSTTIELRHHGVSSVDMVLNNQGFDGEGRALVPPWQFNAMQTFDYGKLFRIDLRYLGNPRWMGCAQGAPHQRVRTDGIRPSWPALRVWISVSQRVVARPLPCMRKTCFHV